MRFKTRKRIYSKDLYTLIAAIIIFLVWILFSTIVKSSSDNIMTISKKIINNVIIDTINYNIKDSVLKKYNANDLITIKYNNNEISNIDYNLENTYTMLEEIKNDITDALSYDYLKKYNYDYKYSDNFLNVKIPFYNYNGNVFLSNLSPKVTSQIGIVKVVNGLVKTKVVTYGINSLKVDLFLNIEVISSIIVPFEKEDVNNSSDILIASKIVNGKIPDYYGGGAINSESGIFNLK